MNEGPNKILVKCEDCAAYIPNPRTLNQGGSCHFNPPIPIVLNGTQINAVFAPVPASGWCMQFHMRPGPPVDPLGYSEV